jgi:hypothetical protein
MRHCHAHHYLTCYLSTYAAISAMSNFLEYYCNQTHLLAEITAIKTLGEKVMKNDDLRFSINIHLVALHSVIKPLSCHVTPSYHQQEKEQS